MTIRLLFWAAFFIMLAWLVNSYIPKPTPKEIVEYYHYEDSIKITQRSYTLAENYVKGLLEKQNKYYKIKNSEYNSEKDCYEIEYLEYQDSLKRTGTGYYNVIYLKLDFQTNGGDYIVTPKILVFK